MEWGCMQALIDFDGWRKWKDISQATVDEGTEKKKNAAKKKAKDRRSLGSNPGAASSRVTIPEGNELDESGNA
jgi:osomolarity two-component system response regulator SSK1